MKPKPFSLLNHFTVPVAMGSSFQSSQPARGSVLVVTVISRLLLKAKHQGTDTNRCNVPSGYTTGCLGVPRRGCWGTRARRGAAVRDRSRPPLRSRPFRWRPPPLRSRPKGRRAPAKGSRPKGRRAPAKGSRPKGRPTAVTRGGATSGTGSPAPSTRDTEAPCRVTWGYVAAVCICALVLYLQEQTRNHRNDQHRSAGWLTALKGATHGYWNREVVQQRKGLRLHRTRRRRT